MDDGRELDALVAEKVFGRPYHAFCWCSYCEYGGDNFSTEIGPAWQVVEKLISLTKPYQHKGENYPLHYVVFTLEHHEKNEINGDNEWAVRMMLLPDGQWEEYEAPTAPHAICLAALKAVGYDPTPSP